MNKKRYSWLMRYSEKEMKTLKSFRIIWNHHKIKEIKILTTNNHHPSTKEITNPNFTK